MEIADDFYQLNKLTASQLKNPRHSEENPTMQNPHLTIVSKLNAIAILEELDKTIFSLFQLRR